MLPRPHRLRHAADIQRVRRSGRRWRHPLVRLMVLANNQSVSRFAIAAGRPVGNAVVRNRSKRLLRESLRHHLPHIPAGWDCLFAANSAITGLDFVEVDAAVQTLLKQASLWQGEQQPKD